MVAIESEQAAAAGDAAGRDGGADGVARNLAEPAGWISRLRPCSSVTGCCLTDYVGGASVRQRDHRQGALAPEAGPDQLHACACPPTASCTCRSRMGRATAGSFTSSGPATPAPRSFLTPRSRAVCLGTAAAFKQQGVPLHHREALLLLESKDDNPNGTPAWPEIAGGGAPAQPRAITASALTRSTTRRLPQMRIRTMDVLMRPGQKVCFSQNGSLRTWKGDNDKLYEVAWSGGARRAAVNWTHFIPGTTARVRSEMDAGDSMTRGSWWRPEPNARLTAGAFEGQLLRRLEGTVRGPDVAGAAL